MPDLINQMLVVHSIKLLNLHDHYFAIALTPLCIFRTIFLPKNRTIILTIFLLYQID